MSIFDSLKKYASSWTVKDRRAFSHEEMDCVKDAVVVESQYGLSAKFTLKSGGVAYIPMSENSALGLGESIDLSKVQLLTLGREGDNDILRVEC